MRNLALLLVALTTLASGCAHKRLSGADLDAVSQPAFISRIVDGAGPRSDVFRGDGAYRPKLKKLDPREADRRLAVKLGKGMSRFEVAERLRATTSSMLPQERPWTDTVNPAAVAQALQSFLVDEVPANPPDYELVRELGADTVVEFVIEEYGMRSDGGKAGAYMLGYGRMFRIGGGEIWRRSFKVDSLEAGITGVDPFAVGKDPQLYRELMQDMLDGVAVQFAKDLSPSDRRRGGEVLPASGTGARKPGGDSQAPEKFTDDELPPGELPAPEEEDPI